MNKIVIPKPEDYSYMDTSEMVEEIKKVFVKYPHLNQSEFEHLRVLSNNLSVSCASIIWELKNYPNMYD